METKRRFSSLIAALAIAVAVHACAPPAAPSVNVNNVVNVSVTVTTTVLFGGDGIASKKEGCAAIGQLEIERPQVLAVGASGKLSATPRDSSGNKRSPECDDADGITWSFTPSDVATVEDPAKFVTNLFGKKTGSGSLAVAVGAARAQFLVTVQ